MYQPKKCFHGWISHFKLKRFENISFHFHNLFFGVCIIRNITKIINMWGTDFFIFSIHKPQHAFIRINHHKIYKTRLLKDRYEMLTKQWALKRHQEAEAFAYSEHWLISIYQCTKLSDTKCQKEACTPQLPQPTNLPKLLSCSQSHLSAPFQYNSTVVFSSFPPKPNLNKPLTKFKIIQLQIQSKHNNQINKAINSISSIISSHTIHGTTNRSILHCTTIIYSTRFSLIQQD